MSPLAYTYREALAIASSEPSLAQLLAYGLQCFRQERYVEGMAFFTLAHEQLGQDEIQLATMLERLIQSHTSHSNAQNELIQASRRFTEVDADLQAQVVALANLLPSMEEPAHKMSHAAAQSQRKNGETFSSYQHEAPAVEPEGEKLPAPIARLQSADDRGELLRPTAQSGPEDGTMLPALYATCFGRFQISRSGKPIELCSSRSGQAILRYLIAQAEHSASKDTLMALLWPENEPEVARCKLHIAVCALRRSLNRGYSSETGSGYIVCKNQVYSLNSGIVVRTDVDEFLHFYQVGQQARQERLGLFEKACSLYTGLFLPEDIYADWSFLPREQLRQVYLTMCRFLADHYLQARSYEEAAKWTLQALKEDRCDEESHRRLIQVYIAQGRRSEALQQYHRCERILREELGVQPLPETTRVFHEMLTGAHLSEDKAKL